MMSLKDYKKRLVKIWFAGFFVLVLIVGGARWQGRNDPATGPHSVPRDVATTLLVAILLPSLIVVRGYYRYKKWFQEQPSGDSPQ